MRRKNFSFLLLLTLMAASCLIFLSLRSQAYPGSSTDSISFQNSPEGAPSSTEKFGQGERILYRSTYSRSRTDTNNNQVIWSGDLQAISVDSLGNSRSLWSASDQLSALSDVTTQRIYNARADTGRYIFTYLDLNGDGNVDNSEIKDFVPETFSDGFYGVLDVPDPVSADALVNYIRGDESRNSSRNLRNRTLDIDGDRTVEVMRLGDIVHSAAIEVSAPSEAYDLLYGDDSYGRFRNQYAERRKVVYVGANDGMVHAFNAGFDGASTHTPNVEHPLGSELWAYIPYNLLPRLKDLQSPDYAHAWFMDGSPRIFDAKVFAKDSTHPDGWGTIMVVGMRFGGSRSRIDVKTNAKGVSSFSINGTPLSTMQFQSAYVLMDITDPEQKPGLIAEITDPDSLGYTTSRPTVATFATTSSNADNRWYLIFGSGPTLADGHEPISATASGTAKLYAYDLTQRKFVHTDGHLYLYDLGSDLATGAPHSFVGDPVAVDWDMNYKADALYFGTIGGDEETPSGKLFKLDFNPSPRDSAQDKWPAPVVLTNTNNPISTAPAITRDEYGQHWILAGTGRFYSENDGRSKQLQNLFAVIDTLPAQASEYKNLVDVSNVKNPIAGITKALSEGTSQSALQSQIREHKGWKRALKDNPGPSAERSINKIALLGNTLVATTFTPGGGSDAKDGKSYLYCLDYRTGMPNAGPASCSHAAGTTPASAPGNDIVDLGPGLLTSPTLYIDKTADSDLSIFIQSSTGAVNQRSIHSPQHIRSGEIDWRELHP